MGKLDKQIFSMYSEYECERQLLITIGREDPRWTDPPRKITPLTRLRRKTNYALKLGKEYEQEIYDFLKRLPEVIYSLNPEDNVVMTKLTKQVLEDLYTELQGEKNQKILLEHFFSTPIEFFHSILGSQIDEIPAESRSLRPDIIIIGFHQGRIRELVENGKIRIIPEEELKKRIGINIIDIKVSNEDSIGKKQLIELVYYCVAFRYFLKKHDLIDKFYINLDNNGILPNVQKVIFRSIEDIHDHIVQLKWEETWRIYLDTTSTIQDLWKNAPQPIVNTLVNILSACGRCNYLEDCKITLGCIENSDPRDWDLRLLPITSRSIVEQLLQRGFKTVGDVADRIGEIEVGNTPEAIYPILPLLDLKSRALAKNEEVVPAEGSIHSVSIPNYNEINLIFTLDTDPIYQRAFGIGFNYTVIVSSKLGERSKSRYYNENFHLWWRLWKEHLEEEKEIGVIVEELNDHFTFEFTEFQARRFSRALKELKKTSHKFEIILAGEIKEDNTTYKQTIVNMIYTAVNGGHKNSHEIEFSKKVVKTLFNLLLITDYQEQFLSVEVEENEKTFVYGPIMAMFYWSQEILEQVQELLERNLQSLVFDETTREPFKYLVHWLTPSESNVRDPSQHKKVFDLRMFAETTRGYPAIISYTWHEIAKRKFGTKTSKQYWNPHFNYMDFQIWHELIAESDIEQKNDILQKIKKQLAHKVRTLDQLRRDFQTSSRHLISRGSRVTTMRGSRDVRLPSTYHYLAQLWYIFAKLTASVDELETLYYRTMYPEFSIGKLAAAMVSNLQEHDGTTSSRRYYTFQLRGLSSNMKIKEGDSVLLFPSELRNRYVYPRGWEIKIGEMRWIVAENCYDVTTQEGTNRLYESLWDRYELRESEQWYLYPKSIDAWSTKLIRTNADGLLQRLNFGASWLGERLSFNWNLIPNQELEYPETFDFNLPEVYLYAPELLDPFYSAIDQNLQSNIIPQPDPSQKEAIGHSLSRPISVIVGPPGTGKSQTIIALIDEYLCRTDRPVRILITSFSYPAMRVIVDKLRESHYENQLGRANQIDKVFMRSEYQNPISNEDIDEDSPEFVHDLARGSSSWKLNGRGRTIVKKKKLEDHFPNSLIVFANAHVLYRLREREEGGTFKGVRPDFCFDLIIIDEASQLPADYILSSLQFVRNFSVQTTFGQPIENNEKITSLEVSNSLKITNQLDPERLTKVVIVGDHNQLPPVQPVKPPSKLKKVLGSLFEYYVSEEGHQTAFRQLKINYRSHNNIVKYTSELGFYEDLRAFAENADRVILGMVPENASQLVKEAMNPDRVVSSIIHNREFEVAVSPIEAEIAVELIVAYYKMVNPQTREDQLEFWEREVGVVAPHNAQGRLIIRKVYEEFQNQSLSILDDNELMVGLRNTIYSVEKFQGSDRTFIIASVGISSKDQLSAEEEFIYDLTRFNVLTSRAKSKIILIASKNYLNYFPNDRDIADYALKIYHYAMEFCDKSKVIDFDIQGNTELVEFRWL